MSLAAIIRNQKLATDIKIIDAYVDDLNILQVKKIIEEYKPDVMGTTVLMDQHVMPVIWLLKLLKK